MQPHVPVMVEWGGAGSGHAPISKPSAQAHMPGAAGLALEGGDAAQRQGSAALGYEDSPTRPPGAGAPVNYLSAMLTYLAKVAPPAERKSYMFVKPPFRSFNIALASTRVQADLMRMARARPPSLLASQQADASLCSLCRSS